MKEVIFDFGRNSFPIQVPQQAEILKMGTPTKIKEPEYEIRQALRAPINSPPLHQIVKNKLSAVPNAKAVIVISDNTRPVPYSGKSGILFPLVTELIKAGLSVSQISILVATGTHHSMSEKALRELLDPRIFSLGIKIINHDCKDKASLICIGETEFGGKIFLNRLYIESDIKILTGLVESHFMAGVSGGRKSICPGLLAEDSTYLLHGGQILSSPQAKDLSLINNPVHKEALAVAKMAGCDMIINVTLDSNYQLNGIFAGALESAHMKAYNKLKSYAAIPVSKKYDLVITHAGFVGINHYQAAKGALICLPLIHSESICLLAASHPDTDPIGGDNYKSMLRLLNALGTEKYLRKILAPEWTFVPEQWEAQMWGRLFKIIPPENLIYATLDIPIDDFSHIPGQDARAITSSKDNLQQLTNESIKWAVAKLDRELNQPPLIAVLPDGPYGIPVST